MRRRGFTLIEGVVAIVILSIAVPVSVAMMADASSARAASVQRDRAVHLVRLIRNEIVADIAAPSAGLGVTLLDDENAYDTALRERIAERTRTYEDLGFSWSFEVGPDVGPRGVRSPDADQNIYRPVTLSVEWNGARSGTQSMDITIYVTEVGA